MIRLIDEEIKQARKKKYAAITLKMNSLSDEMMIEKLYEAARAGVQLKLIIRGIFCMISENKKFKKSVPIWNEELKQELKDILNIQLEDNVKARWLDNELNNEYVRTTKKKIRSQVETYNYLHKKTLIHRETGSN